MSKISDYIGKEFYISTMLGDNRFKITSTIGDLVKVVWEPFTENDYSFYTVNEVLEYIEDKNWIIIE